MSRKNKKSNLKKKISRSVGKNTTRLKVFLKYLLIVVVVVSISIMLFGRRDVISYITVKIARVTTDATSKFLNETGSELEKEKNINVYSKEDRERLDSLIHEEVKSD